MIMMKNELIKDKVKEILRKIGIEIGIWGKREKKRKMEIIEGRIRRWKK